MSKRKTYPIDDNGKCCGCNKLVYKTRTLARQDLHHMKRCPKFHIKRGSLVVYKCKYGNGFHIGHNKKPINLIKNRVR